MKIVSRSGTGPLPLSHGLNFSVRMGLDSGEVLVGKIGDDLRMDYTAQGHTVGLARLCGFTRFVGGVSPHCISLWSLAVPVV